MHVFLILFLCDVFSFLQFGFQRLKDFPHAFWLALFVEGTRFTQAKLLAAQEYASSIGLPVPRNVLIPRTKVRALLHPWTSIFHFLSSLEIHFSWIVVHPTFTMSIYIMIICGYYMFLVDYGNLFVAHFGAPAF